MPDKHRNRKSIKGNQEEDRRGTTGKEDQKVTENPRNLTENVSTAGNEANPKYSRTDIRKEEKERRG